MLRVGLIGCGGMGSVHATVWSEMTDKAELVAVADLNQDKWQKFADKLGAKFYKDAYEICFADAINDGKRKSPVPLLDAIGAMRLIRRELDEAKLH